MDIISNRNLQSYIESQARTVPENSVFAIYDNNSWAFKEVLYREMPSVIGTVSNAFLKLGIKKGDKVNIHCSNCLEYIYSWFALGCIGAIMVPTDIDLSDGAWKDILEHSQAKVVITEPDFIDSFEKIRSSCPSVENVILCKTKKGVPDCLLFRDIVSNVPSKFPEMDVSSQDYAVVYYASGNKGNPRGIVLTQGYYMYWGEVISKTLKYLNKEVVIEVNQISNPVHQINSVMAAFIAGSKLVLSEKFDESDWVHQVGRFAPYWQKNMARGVVSFVTANQARQVLAQPSSLRDNKTALRMTMYTGELSQEEVTQFANRFQTPMTRFFGIPECAALFMNSVSQTMKTESVGRPTLGAKVRVVDDNGKEVSAGKLGKLAINGEPGETFCSGYYNDQDMTIKAIKEGWLYTNIKARVDGEGYFYLPDYVDRAAPAEGAGETTKREKPVKQVYYSAPSPFESKY